MVNQSVLYQTTETCRDVSILRRWRLNFNGSRKPVFHPTIGRESETVTFIERCLLTFGGLSDGFAQRHLNRNAAPP
jgi:hypothetical protein